MIFISYSLCYFRILFLQNDFCDRLKLTTKAITIMVLGSRLYQTLRELK